MKKLFIVFGLFLSMFIGKEAEAKNYGLSKVDAIELVHRVVPYIFEKDHLEWSNLIVGTLSAETDLGQFKAGSKLGIGQVTKIAHKFLLQELDKKSNKDVNDSVTYFLGREFKSISFSELEKDNEASVIATGLYYKFLLEKKKGFSIKGKDPASLWKKYYNTSAGAGSVEGFNKALNRKTTQLALSDFNWKMVQEMLGNLVKAKHGVYRYIENIKNGIGFAEETFLFLINGGLSNYSSLLRTEVTRETFVFDKVAVIVEDTVEKLNTINSIKTISGLA